MINRIVVRYVDGTIKKGTTANFSPSKVNFHLTDKDNGTSEQIDLSHLKAIFFVKSFDGDPDYQERSDVERVGLGKVIKVLFSDGETLVGYTQGFSPARASFIVFPSDPASNNQKVFVVTAATKEVNFL